MSTAAKAARRALMWLGIILVVGYGALATGVLTGKTTLAPGLALDLAGGRQLTLQATTTDGSEVTETDLEQAVEIIRRRVDGAGVAEAEISTQGSDVIIVSLPGNPSDETVDLVRQSAQLQFRPVLEIDSPYPVTISDPTSSPSASASADAEASEDVASEDSAADASATTSPSPSATASPSADASSGEESTDDPLSGTTDEEVSPSSLTWITEDLRAYGDALDCTDPANLGGVDLGDPAGGHVACSADGLAKLYLGPVELTGSDLDTATSGPALGPTGNLTGQFEVVMTFNSDGAQVFDEISQRLITLPSPQNQFAIMLDGVVISYPVMNQRIPDGTAQITGNFTADEAAALANQLKFGALPLQLEVQSNDLVPATLGADQLRSGLIAGLIGLILVVIYSVFQYRALGLVTVGSLLLAGVMTFLAIDLLYWAIGYRLSLAGVAGLIVAIGVTADSFIVYFERVRDELRSGRSLNSAIEHAWKRARRTILVSDAINLLAAVVLYLLAVGSVRGFAFTLGLTTIIDVIIVILFTHPMLVLLARTKFFGEGHPWSGLDPRQLGRDTIYKGRGRVVTTPQTQTLAERKAAAAKGES